MENVIVLERSSEEVSVELEKPRNEENYNPEGGSSMVTTQNKKRSRVTFYRPSPYPLANGLLIGFWDK